MSAFDPNTFLDQVQEKANETTYVPVPEGDYRGIITKIEGRSTTGGSPVLRCTVELDDAEVAKKLNLETLIVNYDIFLDLNEQGGLAFGANQNVKLGQLRAALGQNKDGKPWSPRMLEGAGPILVSVSQRPDKNDPTKVYNDVKKVVGI